MPQLSPLNWMFLFMFFWLFMLMICVSIWWRLNLSYLMVSLPFKITFCKWYW